MQCSGCNRSQYLKNLEIWLSGNPYRNQQKDAILFFLLCPRKWLKRLSQSLPRPVFMELAKQVRTEGIAMYLCLFLKLILAIFSCLPRKRKRVGKAGL